MRLSIPALLLVLPFAGAAHAATVTVMISGGMEPAYRALLPQFEKSSGDRLVTVTGASMGANPTAIPARLARGENADVVIAIRGAVDALVARGEVTKDSVTDLGIGHLAMAVKAGAPKPDIHGVAAFRRALLAAKSVATTDSSGGIYVRTVLFKRLGIENEMAAKSVALKGVPVGPAIARGEYQIGFQQLSEFKSMPGVEIVGLVPDALQQATIFSAGMVAKARNSSGAAALIHFLASPAAYSAIEASGLTPAQERH